jgi:hypothetical protein
VCPNGTACVNGACSQCNATTCPNGCCDDFGQCQTGTSSSACGRAGGRCEACGLNSSCSPTAKVCYGNPPSSGLPAAGCRGDAFCIASDGVTTGEVGSCFQPDGGQGFTGGYCLPNCTSAGACQSATCLDVGLPSPKCIGNCIGTGRGSCRTGYICSGLTYNDGGPAAWGVCFPDCRNPGGGCGTGSTCNTSTGECQ